MRVAPPIRDFGLTSPPGRKDGGTHPKRQLRNSDGCEPEGDWNVLERHGVYPMQESTLGG